MASLSTAAALYATSLATFSAKKPQDAAELKHHAKDGKGFINPWESYINRGFWDIAIAMIK